METFKFTLYYLRSITIIFMHVVLSLSMGLIGLVKASFIFKCTSEIFMNMKRNKNQKQTTYALFITNNLDPLKITWNKQTKVSQLRQGKILDLIAIASLHKTYHKKQNFEFRYKDFVIFLITSQYTGNSRHGFNSLPVRSCNSLYGRSRVG